MGDLGYIVAILLGLFLSFGLPLLLITIGFILRNKNPRKSKNFYIVGVVYLIISLGVCGSMMI